VCWLFFVFRLFLLLLSFRLRENARRYITWRILLITLTFRERSIINDRSSTIIIVKKQQYAFVLCIHHYFYNDYIIIVVIMFKQRKQNYALERLSYVLTFFAKAILSVCLSISSSVLSNAFTRVFSSSRNSFSVRGIGCNATALLGNFD
jgi:hypothetical protein